MSDFSVRNRYPFYFRFPTWSVTSGHIVSHGQNVEYVGPHLHPTWSRPGVMMSCDVFTTNTAQLPSSCCFFAPPAVMKRKDRSESPVQPTAKPKPKSGRCSLRGGFGRVEGWKIRSRVWQMLQMLCSSMFKSMWNSHGKATPSLYFQRLICRYSEVFTIPCISIVGLFIERISTSSDSCR